MTAVSQPQPKKESHTQDSLRSTSAMVPLLCAPPAAPACPALLQGNLIAPDLAPSLTTPRAHWRQLPIKGRGLFHAYDVQIRKATLRSCQRFGTLSVGNLIAPDLAPSLTTPRAHWRQLPNKGRGLFHAYLKKHTSQGRTYREQEGCRDGEGFWP